jgi:oxygen-independent coproporphyrinogen III oxidase
MTNKRGRVSDSVGVYISVPFCRAKCTYCNFASGVFGAERMERYVDRVCAEIGGVRDWVEENIPMIASPFGSASPSAGSGRHRVPRRVDTIFFGGGTPSLLSAEQMRRLFAVLRGEFDVDPAAEVTLECAPGQLGEETLEEMLRLGMNRVSFGVQSFVDAEAKAVGRLHTREMCLGEIRRMRAAGVENINVDLIAGLPGQTIASWRESVEVALETGVPHVSVYMLEVDEDSRLGREVLKAGASNQAPVARYGADLVPSEDEIAEWYGSACEWLEAGGIRQYEISNFAREGRGPGKDNDGDSNSSSQNDASARERAGVKGDYRSRHNLKYWRREAYVGFGLDAHSMLRDGVGGVRWANTSELEEYLGEGFEVRGSRFKVGDEGLVQIGARVGVGPEVERVGREKSFEEAMFLGLRLNEGVDLERLRVEFGGELMAGAMEAMRDVVEAGLVVRDGSSVRLTAGGRMASNEVFSRLLVGAPV